MLPGAALGSLAARHVDSLTHTRHTHVDSLTHTRQHFRLVPERPRGSLVLAGAALEALDPSAFRGPPLHAARRSTWEPRSTSGSGRCPRGFRGAPLDAARRSTWCPSAFRGCPPSCCQAQHLGASRLASAGRGSTSGSGRCPSAFRGPPPLMLPGAALGSLAARFCWQGQHFRLWTVPERVGAP